MRNTCQPRCSMRLLISSSRRSTCALLWTCTPSRYTAFFFRCQQKSGTVNLRTTGSCVTMPEVRFALLNALKTSISPRLTVGCKCCLLLKTLHASLCGGYRQFLGGDAELQNFLLPRKLFSTNAATINLRLVWFKEFLNVHVNLG